MIKTKNFKLAEYKIIEGEDGSIWWEAHSGFSSVKMGRCFVRGSILFIEPACTSEENGFLKGEFLDQLSRLPKWKKTKYYSTSFHILRCNPGQAEESPFADNKLSKPTDRKDVSYRLGKFEIFEKGDGKLLWKAYSGQSAIKISKAFVNGDILFLGRCESKKTGIIKKDFLERLFRLPAWKKTRYLCQQYSLYSCETNAICYELGEDLLSNKSSSDMVVIRRRAARKESDIKPKIATKIFIQNHTGTFRSIFSILVLIILKGLFLFIRILFNALKLSFILCTLGWKRILKWVSKLLN